jgi:hypothetical protein
MVSFGFGELANLICEGKRLTKIVEYILLFKVMFIDDHPVTIELPVNFF